MSEPCVLLTGFEPFDGELLNASALAVATLAGGSIAGHRVETRILPVVFGESSRLLLEELERLRPALVVCVGQAAGRAEISLERIAINLEESSTRDNAGLAPAARPVREDGPAAYWSTLPLAAIREELRSAGLPVGFSLSAGSFVCNHVFYALMHALRHETGTRGGFVHIPVTPAQSARLARTPPLPALETERVAAALRLLLATSLRA